MEDDIIPTISYASENLRNSAMYQPEANECPVCQGTDFEHDSRKAEIICRRCGCVLEEAIIDQGPEWRVYGHEQQDRIRVGAPPTNALHDKGLSTEIDFKNRDAHGRSIPAKNLADIYKLRDIQRRSRISGAGERNLAFALGEVDRYCSRLSLTQPIKLDACNIYRKAVDKNLIRGRSIEVVVASSVYAACRRCEFPRTFDEIAEASNVAKKRVAKTYRFLARELNLKLVPTSPADYVPRFASNLGLSGQAQAKAIEIIQKAAEKGLTSGRGPTGVAAAALYIASILLCERKTQHDVADVSGVTEVTIRNRYKELSEQLGDAAIF